MGLLKLKMPGRKSPCILDRQWGLAGIGRDEERVKRVLEHYEDQTKIDRLPRMKLPGTIVPRFFVKVSV